MWKKQILLACILTASISLPVWSDTLVLRSGRTLSGTLTSANPNTITFQDRSGRRYRYSVTDVDSIQFGDTPLSLDNYGPGHGGQDDNRGPAYNSGSYGPPQNDGRNGPDNQVYGGPNNSGYDQANMERVVLPPGTDIAVRTNERIDSKDVVEGQDFSAQIDADILGADGSVAIPRGSSATLVTRRPGGEWRYHVLDVESITVQGRRYRVSTADQELENHRDGVGGNARTGQFVGGGAGVRRNYRCNCRRRKRRGYRSRFREQELERQRK